MYRKQVVKALAEFKFRCLGKHFMEPRVSDEFLLCTILYCARGMGKHNRSENGHGACVTLRTTPLILTLRSMHIKTDY
jgi:hypothetical protein